MIVPEADHLGQRGAVMAGGFDTTDLAHGSERSLRFNHQTNELDDPAMIADQLRILHPPETGFDAIDRRGDEC
jgi:hypothetical protein